MLLKSSLNSFQFNPIFLIIIYAFRDIKGQVLLLCNTNESYGMCSFTWGWVSPRVLSHHDPLLAEHEWDASSIRAADHGGQRSWLFQAGKLTYSPAFAQLDFYVPHLSEACSSIVLLLYWLCSTTKYVPGAKDISKRKEAEKKQNVCTSSNYLPEMI